MKQSGFTERFLKHLDKIDPADVEQFILRTTRERDFTARIFETLTEGVVVFDADVRVTLVNTAARRMLHWPVRRRVAGERLPDLLEPGLLRDRVEIFVADPRPIQNEQMILTPGARKTYSVHLLPIAETEAQAEADQVERGAALILQDLTPLLNRQERDAEVQRIASLALLTGGVAHDIKNPLNSISIHAQLLKRSVSEFADRLDSRRTRAAERVTQSCAAIGEEVERLRKCVDDFIDAARPHKPALAMTDVNGVVEAVARMARMEFEPLGIRVETGLDPELPALMVDEKQLQLILRNLLRNAAEAIQLARRPAGDRRIALRTALLDDMAQIEVADNGCGIPAADLQKIFEPYFTTKFSGSGLGLMAVARIVREHGGRVTVNSRVGEGTVFMIELPVVSRRVKLLGNLPTKNAT